MRVWLYSLGVIAIGCTEREGPIGINEVGDVWFEIYSYESELVDLTGWRVSTAEASLELTGSIDTDEVILVDMLANGLVPTGDLTLEDRTGAVIQAITVPSLADGESFGRIPDGAANWQVIAEPTPGSLNTP